MAKFRPVPSLSPEDAFLSGAASPNAPADGVSPPLAIVPPSPSSVSLSESSEDDLEMVSLTIRIRRRHHDQLVRIAAAEERSLSQIARRILEPEIESRSR